MFLDKKIFHPKKYLEPKKNFVPKKKLDAIFFIQKQN